MKLPFGCFIASAILSFSCLAILFVGFIVFDSYYDQQARASLHSAQPTQRSRVVASPVELYRPRTTQQLATEKLAAQETSISSAGTHASSLPESQHSISDVPRIENALTTHSNDSQALDVEPLLQNDPPPSVIWESNDIDSPYRLPDATESLELDLENEAGDEATTYDWTLTAEMPGDEEPSNIQSEAAFGQALETREAADAKSWDTEQDLLSAHFDLGQTFEQERTETLRPTLAAENQQSLSAGLSEDFIGGDVTESLGPQVEEENFQPEAAAQVPILDEQEIIGSFSGQDEPAGAATMVANPTVLEPSIAQPLPIEPIPPANAWPIPQAVLADVELLRQFPATQEFAEMVDKVLGQLGHMDLADQDCLTLMEYSTDLADGASDYAMQLAEGYPEYIDHATTLLRISYAIRRRMDVWKQVHQLATQPLPMIPAIEFEELHQLILTELEMPEIHALPVGWQGYFMLDEAERIIGISKTSARVVRAKRALCRKILARLHSTSLTSEQSEFARNFLSVPLVQGFQRAATETIDLKQLLVDLEAFENESTTQTDSRLNAHYQNLIWHNDHSLVPLISVIESHYRNANFRFEVSDRFVNQIIPQATPYERPVSDRILGAEVWGQSQISNQLQVEFIPDPSQLNFRFMTVGSVLSDTQSQRSGFVFHNLGNASMNASKEIAIGNQGVSMQPSLVSAKSRQRLLGIRSRLDDLPILGWVARRIAENQQAAKTPEANQIVEKKLQRELRTTVDGEFNERVAQARQQFIQKLYNPLAALELEPIPMELRTQSDRMIIRYRVASHDQWGANSSRPQSVPGCLLGMQIHQTTVNNLLNQIDINGRKFKSEEFVAHINELLGRQPASEQAHDKDVKFEFANRDGIRVDFQDGRVTITLKLKTMRIDSGRTWKGLTVKADYLVEAMGTDVFLTLDEDKGISLSGHKLRLGDEVAARTAFGVIFKPHINFNAIPESVVHLIPRDAVQFTQFTLTNGWLALSVDERIHQAPVKKEPKTARQWGRSR